MTKVELEGGGEKFAARLDWSDEAMEDADEAASELRADPPRKAVPAPVVGYFRPGPKWMDGQMVAAGEPLGEIVALGLTNDVSAPLEGVLADLQVQDGDAVEYGQALAWVVGEK